MISNYLIPGNNARVTHQAPNQMLRSQTQWSSQQLFGGFQWNNEAFQSFINSITNLLQNIYNPQQQQPSQLDAPDIREKPSLPYIDNPHQQQPSQQDVPDIRERPPQPYNYQQLGPSVPFDQQYNDLRPITINKTVALSSEAVENLSNRGLGGTHVISNQQQLQDLANHMGVPESELPTVDFTKQVLIFTTRDQANPIAEEAQVGVSPGGEFRVNFTSASDQDYYEPSGKINIHFAPLEREGLETLITKPINYLTQATGLKVKVN